MKLNKFVLSRDVINIGIILYPILCFIVFECVILICKWGLSITGIISFVIFTDEVYCD